MSGDIRFVGEMTRVEVRPGDIFVLKCDQPISTETAEWLRESLSARLDGAKVIVLDHSLSLGVIGAAEIEEKS